jgi:hypothetical protein
MASIDEAFESLRNMIADIVVSLEVWNTLHGVREKLGLPMVDPAGFSKARYLRAVTEASSNHTIQSAAKKILVSYPGTRGKPSVSDLQIIQDALWWIESNGMQQISNVTRYRVAESLAGIKFWGRLNIGDLLSPIVPSSIEKGFPDVGIDGNLYENLSVFAFYNFFSGSNKLCQDKCVNSAPSQREYIPT